jgi:hypothetical protein
MDEAIDLKVGLGDKAAVVLGGGGGLSEPPQQSGCRLVGQSVCKTL